MLLPIDVDQVVPYAVEHVQSAELTSRLQGLPLQIFHHSCHTAFPLEITGDVSSATTLDLLKSLGVILRVRIPDWCCIFNSGSDKGGVRCFLNFTGTAAEVATKECSGGVCLLDDVVDVSVEGELGINVDSQILGGLNFLKHMVMDGVRALEWIPFVCYSQNLTF